MAVPTTQNSSEISQHIEKCAEDTNPCQETLNLKDGPAPSGLERKVTKGRKIGISVLLILCNSLLVRHACHWAAHMLTAESVSFLRALSWGSLRDWKVIWSL
jgi:hypothetical protein